MSFRRVDELPALIRSVHRLRSPAKLAAAAAELVNILQPMCDEAVDRRNAAVMRLHGGGRSLDDIGRITGLSRARVHQIVQRQRAQTSTGGPVGEA